MFDVLSCVLLRIENVFVFSFFFRINFLFFFVSRLSTWLCSRETDRQAMEQTRSILCYGDSNTWGFVPGSFGARARYDRNVRWTGRLQTLLDTAQFYIIEEGLNGRTTNLDYTNKPKGYRGTEFLFALLHSHAPIDLIIIMLGINDLKQEFHNRTSEHVTQGIREHIDIIRSTDFGPTTSVAPSILIVSTPLPVPTDCQYTADMFDGARQRVENLPHHLQGLVNEYKNDVYFVDAAPHVQLSSVDGIHFDEKAHEQFALLMKTTIERIFRMSS
jgi:lysophospholipase L1-like esterase